MCNSAVCRAKRDITTIPEEAEEEETREGGEEMEQEKGEGERRGKK